MYRSINKACNLRNTCSSISCNRSNSVEKSFIFSRSFIFGKQPSNQTRSSPSRICVENVRKYDFENYLSSALIYNSFVRRTAFAIRALNVELAQTRDLTSNETSAQIRLQFWSDIISDIFDGIESGVVTSGSQPIAYEIQRCLLASNKTLSKRWFTLLIDSRKSLVNLSSFPFSTLKDLETYFDSSVSPVFYLINEAVRTVSQKDKKVWSNIHIKLDHVANHVAKAQGFCNILRGITHNALYGRCYLPAELLVAHKVSVEQIVRKTDSQHVRDVTFDLACSAEQHLRKAESLWKDKDVREYRSVFLPIIPTEIFLQRLQRCNFNVFDPRLQSREGSLPFRLWINSKLIKYNIK